MCVCVLYILVLLCVCSKSVRVVCMRGCVLGVHEYLCVYECVLVGVLYTCVFLNVCVCEDRYMDR